MLLFVEELLESGNLNEEFFCEKLLKRGDFGLELFCEMLLGRDDLDDEYEWVFGSSFDNFHFSSM